MLTKTQAHILIETGEDVKPFVRAGIGARANARQKLFADGLLRFCTPGGASTGVGRARRFYCLSKTGRRLYRLINPTLTGEGYGGVSPPKEPADDAPPSH